MCSACWEADDKHALRNALLATYTCPNDRSDLRPVPLLEDTWGCELCKETWYIHRENAEVPHAE